MNKLDEHMSTHRSASEVESVPVRNSQAEKLIAYLEAVRDGESAEGLSLKDLIEEEERSIAQARTQVLHTNPSAPGSDQIEKRAQADCPGDAQRVVMTAAEEKAREREQTSTQSDRPACNLTVHDNIFKASTSAYAGLKAVVRAASHKAASDAIDNDSTHQRELRIKKMEGPANTAVELAEKLSCFTYYELLYLDDDAEIEDIHAAYVKRTTDIRSRFRIGAFTQEWRLTEFIRALHEAHTVLTNSELRQEYDARLADGNWEGSFRDLLAKTPNAKKGLHWSNSANSEVSLKELLLIAGFVSEAELKPYLPTDCEGPESTVDGPELAQVLADCGLISFEELASVLLGKALIDRRQITVEQFKQAVNDMRDHSHKFVDALINQGWLTHSELKMLGIS